MWIIPCKFDPKYPVIFDCLSSLRINHPYEQIVVVDSDSEDKSYFEYVDRMWGVEVIDAKNRNYGTNAYYIGYRAYPDEDYYYCIYDSLMVYDNLNDMQANSITSFRYFKTPPTGWGWDGEGTPLEIWGEEQLNKIGMTIPSSFHGIMGPMFGATREVMEKLYVVGLFSILPEDKYELCALERVYGIAFEKLGYDFWTHSLQGEMIDFWGDYPSERVKKLNVARM